ncbi:MAG: SlyX family protein [Phycisphaerales bacterium]|nr:SlyX family protein [Phycisphaerales bacterium]
MSPQSHPDPSQHQHNQRIERLEELLMFADRRHETLSAHVDELSKQLAAMHRLVEQFGKRLKDAERTATSGEPARSPEDEVPPHNAF